MHVGGTHLVAGAAARGRRIDRTGLPKLCITDSFAQESGVPMLLAREVLGCVICVTTGLAAQGSPSRPPAPNTGKEQGFEVGVARSPLLAERDQRDLAVWGQCAALRRQLNLPAKAADAHLARVLQPRSDAMRHVSLGLAVIRDAQPLEEQAKRDQQRWQQFVRVRNGKVLRHFTTAIVRYPASLDALLALANTSRDSLVATLALRAITPEAIAQYATDRTASLLSVLLEHCFPEVAELAYSHLEFLLDAGVSDGGVHAQLAARAKNLWPEVDRDVLVGDWSAKRVFVPELSLISPLPPPANLSSRLLVLSALHADDEVLTRFIKGDFDPRILIHAHCLAAPRVDERSAAQLFRWYRIQPPKWQGKHELLINPWKYGVLTVLVCVLPKLPAKHLTWYQQHLVASNTGAAVTALSLHRLACLERSRGTRWFDVRSGAMNKIKASELLSMWHYLGSHEQWTLAGCMKVAPRESIVAVAEYYGRCVLRSAPVGESADELSLLADLWQEAKPGLARAIARRAQLHGSAGQKALHGWLRSAVRTKNSLSATALELAIAHGLPLPSRNWPRPALQCRELQTLHDAFYAQDSDGLNALLAAPVVDATGCQLRATLYAALRLTQWSSELAMLAARATTNHHPDTRRAAYAALASDGAQAHEVSWLAREAAFDVDADVRRGQ
tara:strand:+ start:782 stop:2800 length:2019 start_codon:yes stop_codon:yes gene_type:complete